MAKSAKANSGAKGVPDGLPEGLGALSASTRREQREAVREERKAERAAERAERQEERAERKAEQQAQKQAKQQVPEIAAATNTITGTDGNDVLSGTATDDLILGLAGDDQLNGLGGSDTLYGAEDNDDLRGGAQQDTLFGGNGADVLNGNGGDDSLEGEGGADTFLSSNGNDTMRGGGGNDTVYQTDFTGNPGYFGGAGDGDSYIVEDNDLAAHAWLITPTALSPPIPDTAWEVRRDGALLASGAQTEHLTIVAGFGNDDLSFIGFAGALGIESIRFDGRLGNDRIVALGVPESIHISFAGGSGQDELFGHSGTDSMRGGSGNDMFLGADGDDVYATGFDEGTDTANGGSGSDLFIGEGDRNLPSDWTLHGSGAGNLTAALNGGANGLTHASLFESIRLHSSLANDTLSLAGDLSGIVQISIDMEDGNDLLAGRGTSQIGSANVIADLGGGDDTVLDSSANDTIFAGSGNDTMDHAEGSDDFNGQDGNDTVVYSNQVDAFGAGAGVNFFGGSGTDLGVVQANLRPGTSFLVDNASDGGIVAADGNKIIAHSQMEVLHVFAGSQNDQLGYANSAALQRLEVFGGAGDDKVFARVSASDQVDLYAEGGLGNDTLWAGGGSDTLLGQDGLDRLRGGSAGDSLHGGVGADSLFGEAGDDVLFFDIADLAIFGGSGLDTLIGNATADSVQFDAARFQFGTERASIEEVRLGNGNDIFNNHSNPADFTQINADGISVFGGSGSDRISMRGAGAPSGIEDFVDGGSGHDEIWGGFGNDELWGGDGGDFIYGGKGDDKLQGGSGFDVFYVGQAEGEDAIEDNLAEVNGLVLFWGWDSTFPPPSGSGAEVFDGVDPDEVDIAYNGNLVEITFVERGGTVIFEREFNSGTGLWDSSIDVINLWDYGNGDAGNSPTVPPQFGRDVWSATFDAASGAFTAFTLAVDG